LAEIFGDPILESEGEDSGRLDGRPFGENAYTEELVPLSEKNGLLYMGAHGYFYRGERQARLRKGSWP
jgi:hypothetical protein